MFSGAKKSATGTASGHRAEEAVRLLLVLAEGAEEHLHLRSWRRERRKLVGELVDGQRVLVALLLVSGERLLEGPAAAQPGVDRVREQLGVAEGVRDALRRERVLVIAASPTSAQPGPYGLRKKKGRSAVP